MPAAFSEECAMQALGFAAQLRSAVDRGARRAVRHSLGWLELMRGEGCLTDAEYRRIRRAVIRASLRLAEGDRAGAHAAVSEALGALARAVADKCGVA